MIIVNATPADLDLLVSFRTEAAEWLGALGVDQWRKPYPRELLLASIEAGTVFLVSDGDQVAGTVTLDQEDLEPGAWTDEELKEPALYVHKLAVRRAHSGRNLGGRVLDWAGDRAACAGAHWLRLDAWTNNRKLQGYYLKQGFQHVRTVTGGDAVNGGPRVSGWLAQRPAHRVAHGFDDHTQRPQMVI
ncbi:GNAT family acetyltransferase [Wenjunlia vitaminophila]|uniref:GNAT family acetyltransferase n=1 Tax=Wenjunlia vitaminophila TaxID=76728 RepID=A0A0T6LN71_WENVI|nr:GNAT family N-acetyltransferase [Wenjunlia vitaminophila]KRV47534.1 GNAT family acetyltransferase [Wenjunlia vitaminophila]